MKKEELLNLKNNEQVQQIMILLTDGQSNDAIYLQQAVSDAKANLKGGVNKTIISILTSS
jgi:Mg-chelatase subunit ChlD